MTLQQLIEKQAKTRQELKVIKRIASLPADKQDKALFLSMLKVG
jgi:hypothetical protein